MTIFESIRTLRAMCGGGLLAILLLAFGAEINIASAQTKAAGNENKGCAPIGSWSVPGGGKVSGPDIIARAAKRSVVLLGEMHDNPEHHQWQLQVLAALHAVRPDMIIGFEMFPRRVQKVLDQWVAGELSEAEFHALRKV